MAFFSLLVDVKVGGVGGVDAEVHKGDHFIIGEHVGGVEFGVGEFWEGLEGFLGNWVGGGANREGNEDFAEVEVVGFEIGNAVFDIENRSEDGGGDEVDGVGDVVDGFEGV